MFYRLSFLNWTQICRNINRIKVCMETGKTVVLLNLDNLYESLYDALNQVSLLWGAFFFSFLFLIYFFFKLLLLVTQSPVEEYLGTNRFDMAAWLLGPLS